MDGDDILVEPLVALKDAAPAGYALVMHIHFTAARYTFQTYPEGWMKNYAEQALVMRDPTVLWGMQNTGFKRWSDLADLDTGNVYGMAKDFGINHGFVYVTDAGGGRSLTGFARSDRPHTEEEMQAIADLVAPIHEATRSLDRLSMRTIESLRLHDISFTQP